MKETHTARVATLKQGAASAMSLLAITAGTVSAALVIMFFGFYMTVLSIGSSAQSEIYAANVSAQPVVSQVSMTKGMARDGKQARKAEKGHFMDALLREDSHRPSAIVAENSARPATKKIRIYANPMSMPFVSEKSRITHI